MAFNIQACTKVRETYDLGVMNGTITQFDEEIRSYLANHCNKERKIGNSEISDYLDAFHIDNGKLQYVVRTRLFSRVLALALLSQNPDADVKICSANIPFLDNSTGINYSWVESGNYIYDSYFVGVWDKDAWYAVFTPLTESVVVTPSSEDDLFLLIKEGTEETPHNYTNLLMQSHVRKSCPELKYFDYSENDATIFEYQAAAFREWRKVLLSSNVGKEQYDIPPEFLSPPFIKALDLNIESGYDTKVSKESVLRHLFEFVTSNYEFYESHREDKPINGNSLLVQAYRKPGESDLYVVSLLESIPSIISEMNNRNMNRTLTSPGYNPGQGE